MRIGECTNESDLVAALEVARQRRLNARRGWETIWWNNIALVAGDHYAKWNPNRALYEDRDPIFDPQLINKKPRIVINHALTVARTELSKLTKAHPIMEVIANSDEADDIAATKVGKRVLDASEWKFHLRKLRKDTLWWMIECGVGAMYVGWDYMDETAGTIKFTIDPATGEPTFNPDRKRQIQDMVDNGELDSLPEDEFPLGEIEVKVYSAFQLFPDETVIDFGEMKDLITSEVADIDVVKGIYGRAAGHLNPEQTMVGVQESRMMQRMGVVNPSLTTYTESGVNMHTWWLLPNVYRGNKFLKNGKMVRWAQGKPLEVSNGYPFQDNRIPFVFFQHIPSSTSIWPDSVIQHIRGPNLEIDKTVSQLIENKDYMANPMWRIATQHKIKGQIKNQAGSIVRYVHVPNVPPPEPIPGIQMPAQVESLLAGLREQILDISGQSEVARGRVPTGVRSGVAVAYLQEEDDTKIAPTIENMEEQIALMGSLFLERYSQFYTVNRLLRYYRRDGQFDVVKFKGADLKNNTDVVCQAGSAMPKAKAARQQYTLELVSLGILTDPDQIKEMLDLGEGEPSNRDKSVSQANRENQIMIHGLPSEQFKLPANPNEQDVNRYMAAAVPVKKWHDHPTHIERHTSVMMDEEFDRMQITHPGIVRLFDEHIAVHEQFLAQAQMAQAQMLEAAKGAPEGAGGVPAGTPSNGLPSQGQGQQQMTRQVAPVDDVVGGAGQITARTTRTS